MCTRHDTEHLGRFEDFGPVFNPDGTPTEFTKGMFRLDEQGKPPRFDPEPDPSDASLEGAFYGGQSRLTSESSWCPACGDVIDFCRGHGLMGDTQGYVTLRRHDMGNHRDCDPGPRCRCESDKVYTEGRCEKHGAMMKVIRTASDFGSEAINRKLWELQDGYGDEGFTPIQGWDWSGIRDSSVDAIEAMYAAVQPKGARS